MNKLIIRHALGENMTREELDFANCCVRWFIDDLEAKTYGDSWNGCAYTSVKDNNISCVTHLKNTGTISAVIHNAFNIR